MTEPPARSVSLGDAYTFFLPLVFMAEMMMISHSVIHAFLARLPDPTTTLAAYNVAFSFHAVAGSPMWTALMTSLALVQGRRSVARLIDFHLRISVLIVALGYLLAFTGLGDWFFGSLMGAGPLVVKEAKAALVIFMWIPPITVFRSLAYTLLMRNRRTILITVGTFVRLLALGGYLAVLPSFVSGAAVGAAALFLCILTETVLAVLLTWRYYQALPVETEAPPGHREIWNFAWPLMLTQASENGVAITINFFLGRLVRPELALAAFGVADGLWKVMLGPLRNLAQTAQTLMRSTEDRRVMMVFCLQVSTGFSLLAAIFLLPPARNFLLGAVMGLTPELSGGVAPAVSLFWALAFMLGFAALFKGLLLNMRVTSQIALSALARFGVVVSIGSASLLLPDANGAVLGVSAMMGGFCAEAWVLGRRIWRPQEA